MPKPPKSRFPLKSLPTRRAGVGRRVQEKTLQCRANNSDRGKKGGLWGALHAQVSIAARERSVVSRWAGTQVISSTSRQMSPLSPTWSVTSQKDPFHFEGPLEWTVVCTRGLCQWPDWHNWRESNRQVVTTKVKPLSLVLNLVDEDSRHGRVEQD